MNELTLVVAYYRNCAMLKRQVEEWNKYPQGIKVICVDDGSPEPALPIILQAIQKSFIYPFDPTKVFEAPVQLYRIGIDRPWNRSGARNLGSHVATTEWILQVDIDHILPADAAAKLLNFQPDPNRWYRFPRWRVGKADETRKKDAIPNDQEYGQVHPHVDSYLVRKEVYWQTGGYNEDYSGCLGGGSPFLRRLEMLQPVEMLPPPIRLEVYTRDVIKDASDWSLSRDKTEYSRRKRIIERNGNKPTNPLRFSWVREL